MLKRVGMVLAGILLVALVLMGCKNALLGEEDATVNGRAAGVRTATITVTNFAP